PWVRMKTTTVPGGAMRPPSVARPSSAALDPWLCGPVLRRVCPYREGLLSEVGLVQARCQAAVRPGQCSPISGNRGTLGTAELLFRRPGTTVGCCLVTCLGSEFGHSDTSCNGSLFFQQLAPHQRKVVVGLSSSDSSLGHQNSSA